MNEANTRFFEAIRLREPITKKFMEARAYLESAPLAEREEAQRRFDAVKAELDEANRNIDEATRALQGQRQQETPDQEVPDLPRTHTALVLLVDKGRSYFGPGGRGMVDPGTPVAVFLVPTEAITEEGMQALEEQSHLFGKAIEEMDIPAVLCDSLVEVQVAIRHFHGKP